MRTSDHTIAIIGAGFTGTLVAVNLRRILPASAKIILIDSREGIGGLAYSAFSDRMKLNVHASTMGAFPETPDDFLNWLNSSGKDVRADEFVPRVLYRRYLDDLLNQSWPANSSGRGSQGCATVRVIHDRVVDLQLQADGKKAKLCFASNDTPIEVDGVVLAIGHLQREMFAGVSVADVFCSPYLSTTYENADSLESVLILGSGLTAVDAILEFEGVGFSGTYHVISRHGFFPVPHEDGCPNKPLPEWFLACDSVRELLHLFRLTAPDNILTQALIQSVRPVLQARWASLSIIEKQRFLRHVKAHWDSHRHRIPAEHANVLDELGRDGRLKLLAGRVKAIHSGPARSVSMEFVRRGRATSELLNSSRAVFCAGSEGVVSTSNDPLVLSLLKRGYLTESKLKLGAHVSRETLPSDFVNRLHFVGPLQREELWEITAVRELRVEAQRVANELSSELGKV